MCQAPLALPNGQTIACRKCKLCNFNRVKDWAGRNVAQSKVSTRSFAGDLTYGPELDENRVPIKGREDHIRTAVLTYSDVQNFFKYLRYLGYEFAYFITGENGSLKGRAHWHFIIHFHGKVPKVVLGKNFSDRHKNQYGELFDFEVCKAWPHGFMFWKKAAYEDCFYACKYILKDEGDENSQRKPGLSKKPPLGAAYFEKLAEQAVAQGIAPQTLEYRFPEIKQTKTKEPVLFYLQGRSAELYLDHFIKTWAEQRGDQPRPKSDLVDLYEEYGQIVHNEAALLIRREFPKGESRDAFPSGAEIKTMAKAAEAELAEWQIVQAKADRDHWWFTFVSEAKNEQERQKRQELREQHERDEGEQQFDKLKAFHEQQASRGFVFDGVQGRWVKSDVHPGGAGPDTASPRREYGPGKVGRWNQAYGTSTDPGRTGPDHSA